MFDISGSSFLRTPTPFTNKKPKSRSKTNNSNQKVRRKISKKSKRINRRS